MPNYQTIANVVRSRLAHGEYIAKGFPSERRLADEIGASYMTARRAVRHLIDSGVLRRKPNGRLEPVPAPGRSGPRLAVLSPAYRCPVYQEWIDQVFYVASAHQATVRPVEYVHLDDSAISETLEAFDGVFMVFLSTEIPAGLLARLRQATVPVVALDMDLSEAGLPSIVPRPAATVATMLEYLARLGHRRVLCLNAQPRDRMIAQRLDVWQATVKRLGLTGMLCNEPVESYQPSLAGSYLALKKLLAAGRFEATAILGLTEDAAIAAKRVLYEAGIAVPSQVSVCAAANEGLCAYTTPAVTAPQPVDLRSYLHQALDRMLAGPWRGDLLLAPATIELFPGETTAPCPSTSK